MTDTNGSIDLSRSDARARNAKPSSICAVLAMSAFAGACALELPGPSPDLPPGPVGLAQLWVEPRDLERRDLFYGIGGKELAPPTDAPFRFESEKQDIFAFSPGLDVRDEGGHKWDVKLGPEARPEVLASRIIWALGYHQPPVYHLAHWSLIREGAQSEQGSSRFRRKGRHLEKRGSWSWTDNPFEDTQAFRGLLVLMMFLNNWDLTVDNTAVYDLDKEWEGSRRWYVVRDVGASFSRNRGPLLQGTRGDLEGYEQQGFVRGVKDGKVEFDWNGPHGEFFADLTAADVRWTCRMLARIQPAQWDAAFRAAGYEPDEAARLKAQFEKRIAQGRDIG
jgi:hypothetical protein